MRLRAILLAITLLPLISAADDSTKNPGYAEQAGQRVGVYRNESLNFELNLQSLPYVVVDFTQQAPDVSFAAMRSEPPVFVMVIVEDLGAEMSSQQYAEIVKSATSARLAANAAEGDGIGEFEDPAEVRVAGRAAVRLGLRGIVNGVSATYVITALVNGTTAYQIMTFSSGVPADEVKQEADAILEVFSFIGGPAKRARDTKSVDDYHSSAFAYGLKADQSLWLPWSDLDDDYSYADVGALGTKGYGAVVMPVCWQGPRPTQLALLDVYMEQFGEEYPTPFISFEAPIKKGDVSGTYLVGTEPVDDIDYTYYFWIVANDACAYTLSAWGPAESEETQGDLKALWDQFDISGSPDVFTDGSAKPEDRANNAYFLNQIGMHYFNARSYRESYRFLAQATDLDLSDTKYIMNALRALTEIDAYQEAYDWLQPRLDNYGDDLYVRSWDAWLAYQTGDSEKALTLYPQLFSEGYREDEEFAVYAKLLAEREEWDRVEREFAEYTRDGMTESLSRLSANLMTRRGHYDEALAVLDELIAGRPFNADLIYSKIEVYDEMGESAEVLRLADLLIGKNYQSLESYFYKGNAEYRLKSYLKARESFEMALKYSPTNPLIKEYIDSINGILGNGENASISGELRAAELPSDLQMAVENASYAAEVDGYGAFFINRIIGYEFDGGDDITKTYVQQIKVQDSRGVEQFSTLEFNFDPAFEQFYVNSLIVRNADGEIVAEGDRAAYYVTDTVDGYEASTEKTAHLPVPSLSPGAIIEVVATKKIGVETGKFPLDIHYLSSNRPIAYSAIYVTGNHGSLNHDSFGIDKPRTRGKSLIWELTNPVVYRWEPMQPYFDRLLPWVYLGTTSLDWSAAGKVYLDEIQDKLETSRIADTATRLVRGIADDSRKIEIISRYVQKELHYEAIEFGRRAYVPKSARETLRDRYGDCKDHAVLLYSMLNAVDIPAELALVNIHRKVLPELPNIDQFDHMIVSIPLGYERLFIDTTDKDLSLGRTPPRFMAGNYALVLGDTSELVSIPEFSIGDSGLKVEREIERTDNNELKVTEIGVFSGYQAAELRGQLRDIETTEILSMMQRWVAGRYSDAIVDDAYVDHLFEADSELVVELQYRLPLDDHSFKLPSFFEATYLDFSRQPDRRFVFELDVPFSVSTVTTVRQSDKVKIAVDTRKPDADESRFGSWRRRIDRNDDSWVFSLEYTGGQSQYSPEDYSEFAEFHRRLMGSIEQPVVLE